MKSLKYFLFIGCILIAMQGFTQIKIGNNPTTVDPSAVLEIESTSKGILVSRLTTTQRNAIATPANGLLIFNVTNNTFEVFKSLCACWVTVNDGGNNAARDLVNTPPAASSLYYTGRSIAGQTLTLNYTYSDANLDAEGLTTFQWQIASTSAGTDAANISGATSAAYTPVSSNAGLWIRGTVSPRASTGALNGLQTFGAWVQVEAANIPTANNLTVSGTPAQGSTLTATYTFSGGSGTENTGPLLGSSFTWQSATTITGRDLETASLYGASQFKRTYTPQADLIGRFIRVGVRARDNASLQASNFVFSPWVGPVTVATEQAPIVSGLSISPSPAQNLMLTGTYTYYDANNDPEGAITYQWYRADSANGSGQVAIPGATAATYTATATDVNKFMGFGVTPVALTGTTQGTEVIQYHPTPVLPVADFSFTASSIRQLPFFAVNRTMNTLNAIQVEINVASLGGIVFTSNTVNGYSFGSNYTATTTGLQWVTLTASGIQAAYNASGDAFTITGAGVATNTKSITIFNSITGAGLTAFSNGSETFNNSGICRSAIISTGHTAGTCTGNVTVGANTYAQVLINGQCWMQTNLIEAPTAPCSSSINTGCNTWLNTTQPDNGYWGYFNTTVATGASGWSTTVPAANEGLLYQWSAAMNGSTEERSKGVCPTGWHIPSDCEWLYLEHGQGMTIAQQAIETNGTYRTSTGEGTKLKSGGTSGFNGLLAGLRNNSGTFNNRNAIGYFWTSSQTSATSTYTRALNSTSAGVQRFVDSKARAMSVRCLKD